MKFSFYYILYNLSFLITTQAKILGATTNELKKIDSNIFDVKLYKKFNKYKSTCYNKKKLNWEK